MPHNLLSPKTAAAKAAPFALTLLAVSLGACAGSSATAEDDLSGSTIRVVVPTAAGGGLDTTARQIVPSWSEELDAEMTVENVDGGGYAIGSQSSLRGEQDCTTLLLHGIPQFGFSYLTQDVAYSLDDFAPVGGMTVEPAVIRVAESAPWQTLQELIDDAKANPGEISFSVSDLQSNNYIDLLELEKAAGIDLQIVGYDGGGPARTAVVAGEVDGTDAGLFASQAIAEDSRVLAVSAATNEWPDLTGDAPTVSEVVGTTLEPSASNYVVFAPKGCQDDFSARYQQLVDTLKQATSNERYVQTLTELDQEDSIAYLSPDELEALATESESSIASVLSENPDVFSD